MKMSVTNISRVLGRIREIEAMVYPQPTEPPRDEKSERFHTVMKEAMDGDREGASPRETETREATQTQATNTPQKNFKLPAKVDERLALWENDLQDLCAKYQVDPDLARAVMRCESGGNPNAVSSAGAIGLMQLMPATARGLGVDPKNPRRNLEGGIKYLAQLADKYNGDYVKTLAAYNAGSGRVDAYGGVPPFPETQRYVKNVLALYRKYSRGG